MTDTISRRAALMNLATAAGALGATQLLPATAQAAAAPAASSLPHVTPQDPTALALSYFEDASKVDAKKFPTYKAGQLCSNCLQATGNLAKDAWLGCNLFPGKSVAAKGWCKVYVKKP